MNDTNNISKAERKKQFDEMMSKLQEISELTGRSLQLQTEILDLLKSKAPDASEKIENLQNEYDILNKKITDLKIAFDEKYPIADKEWNSDEKIK